MLHGASGRKALRLSGCTSVHPYKYDDIFKFCNTPSFGAGRSAGAGGGAADGGVGVDEFADGALLTAPLEVVGDGDVGGSEVDAHVLYI